jgi:hypothetical protein
LGNSEIEVSNDNNLSTTSFILVNKSPLKEEELQSFEIDENFFQE